MKMRVLVSAVVAATALLSSACNRVVAANQGPEGWPKVLRYNISVSTEDPGARTQRVDLMQKYLQQQLGIPVEIVGSVGYGPTIEAMRAKKIDASSMGPFAYLIASEKAGAEAIATRGSPEGDPGDYGGTLAVAADSPIRSMDDVIQHSKDLTVSFVDPASASGYLVQRAYLDSIGLNPEKAFKKVLFSNNHLASGLTLVAKKVDVAAISEKSLWTLLSRGKVKENELRVIWKSPRIPNSPVAVRKDLPEDFKRKLQEVLVAMATVAPDVYLRSQASVVPGTSFVRVNDATYDELRNMARGVTSAQLLGQ